MMQVALRGLWGRKLRTVLTALSIILGTSMITGTFILRDQINNAFSDIFHESNKGIDVVLSKKTAFTSDNGATAGPLPESVIATAAGVDGVKKAEGQIQATGSIVVDGKYVTGSGGAPNLVFSYVTEPFSNSQFTSGGPPTDGSVAVNQKLADDEHLKVGQQVEIATDKGVVPVTVSGIFKLAGVSSIGGATLVVPTFRDAQRWFDRIGKTSVVYLQAEPGVTPDGAEEARAGGGAERRQGADRASRTPTSRPATSRARPTSSPTRCSRSPAPRCSWASSSSSTPTRSPSPSASASSRCCAPWGRAAARCCARC